VVSGWEKTFECQQGKLPHQGSNETVWGRHHPLETPQHPGGGGVTLGKIGFKPRINSAVGAVEKFYCFSSPLFTPGGRLTCKNGLGLPGGTTREEVTGRTKHEGKVRSCFFAGGVFVFFVLRRAFLTAFCCRSWRILLSPSYTKCQLLQVLTGWSSPAPTSKYSTPPGPGSSWTRVW